jgi:hypothetical protein
MSPPAIAGIDRPASKLIIGYPIVTVPLGTLKTGEPFGLSFIGTKYSEPVLIRLMAAYEAFPAPAQLHMNATTPPLPAY